MQHKQNIHKKNSRENIAIIGAGISGLSLAFLLREKFNVTLYEKSKKLGGHAHTFSKSIKINSFSKKNISFDIGFLVYNEKNYPYFKKLLSILKTKTIKSDMSFSVSNKSNNYEYGSRGILSLTNNFKNIFHMKFWLILFDLFKFYRLSKKLLETNSLDKISLKTFLYKNSFSNYFINDHLIPMCGAIWSSSLNNVMEMPAKFVVVFFDNHGLLNLFNKPKWRSIKNGSVNYVNKIVKEIDGDIYKNEKVKEVIRQKNKVLIKSNNFEKKFDKVIFAMHSDEVLNVLKNPTDSEKRFFSKLKYESNQVYVHQDIKLLPNNNRVWCSWNVIKNKNKLNNLKKNDSICVTYWINNLQNLKSFEPILVTLNPPPTYMPDKKKILKKLTFNHPLFNKYSLNIKKNITYIQGKDRIYFVGAWQGNGFHEDGIKSSVDLAKYFDVEFKYER